jgi:hypothetical protein
MSRKKPPADLRLPRHLLAGLPREEQERILEYLNQNVRLTNTASVTFNDLHKWTMADFENMRTGALNRKGGSKGGSERAERQSFQAKLRARRVAQDFKAGLSMKTIAEKYGITRQGVHKILVHEGCTHPRKK